MRYLFSRLPLWLPAVLAGPSWCCCCGLPLACPAAWQEASGGERGEWSGLLYDMIPEQSRPWPEKILPEKNSQEYQISTP